MAGRNIIHCVDGRPRMNYLWVSFWTALVAMPIEVVAILLVAASLPDRDLLIISQILAGVSKFLWALAILMAAMGLVQFHHVCRTAFADRIKAE